MIPSYPLPERHTNIANDDVFSYGVKCYTYEQYQKQFLRKISSDASRIKNQYLSIEGELLKAFQYVHPSVKNLSTTSVRFATIIRESANLFEIMARTTYFKLFAVAQNEKINIKHFLSLETFLDLSKSTLNAPTIQSDFENTDLLQPFKALEKWNRNSAVLDVHIPRWWTAYNKLKHDINGIEQYATFENALLSIGAVYLTIDRIFGIGVVGGILHKPEKVGSLTTNLIEQHVPVSALFVENTMMYSVGL